MTIKRQMSELEESPRSQKRSSPALSAGSNSSPYFSTSATSPGMPSPDSSLPPYTLHDPALYFMPDVITNNYTTSAMNTAPTALLDLENTSLPLESAAENILSVTPVKSTAGVANDDNLLDFPSPESASSFGGEDGGISYSEFRRMSAEQRQTVYRNAFDQKINIQELGEPSAWSDFPELAEEIIKAHASLTTVVAKVWTNYDSVDKEFYSNSPRIEDCGKIYLSPKELLRLESLDPDLYQMGRVQLDIGTPFRKLAGVNLTSNYLGKGSGWELVVDARLEPDHRSPHREFRKKLEEAMKNIQEDGMANCQTGLTFRDLQAIAMEFLFRPSDEGERRQWFTDW